VFNRYYQQELQNLRELAVEFSRTHPVAAPMLSGPKPDPDVERLLEGVAFLNGLLQQKLDDEFPELVHSLMDVVFPHYMRPSQRSRQYQRRNPARRRPSSFPRGRPSPPYPTMARRALPHLLRRGGSPRKRRHPGGPGGVPPASEMLRLVMELKGITHDRWD
jgi:hypothetical protein